MDADRAGSARCFAADVVRAGLDPLTGRTLTFNHTPMAAWAGHLCDLVLLGALVDVDGDVAAGTLPPDVHPLVHGAFVQLGPALPRPWRWMFAPRVVDISTSVAHTRRWLVDTGMWSRRRTLFGPRYVATGAAPSPTPPDPPGDPVLRRLVLDTLVDLATSGSTGGARRRAAAMPEDASAVAAVLIAADDLVAWKTGHPSLPTTG